MSSEFDSDETRQLTEINERLEYIESTLKSMDEKMGNTESIIRKVAAEVMPTINELMQSPMLKMLGVGKRK